MANIFKVGDIVEANELSNKKYGFTTKENEWSGRVLNVHDNGSFDAETISGKYSVNGADYCDLETKYFDLVKKKPTKKERIKTLELELSAMKERLDALEKWRNA